MLSDLKLNKVDINVLGDDTNTGNLGLVTGDFRLEYDPKSTKPLRTQNLNKPKTKQGVDKGSF